MGHFYKFIIVVCDDIERRFLCQNIELFIWSKTFEYRHIKIYTFIHHNCSKWNKKLRYREEHSASVVLSWCTL